MCAIAFRPFPLPVVVAPARRHGKLRVAYLSANFNRRATASLVAGLFERHDRSKFEITGISFGADEDAVARTRVVSAFDAFHDMRALSDRDIAQRMRDLRIDIAVDLMGHDPDARPGILASRPAPIQVNYLGCPGTMGADFIDYIIADSIVVPPSEEEFYTEKVVRLPDCYQVNDANRVIAETTPTRKEAGLPEKGFVFASFNNGNISRAGVRHLDGAADQDRRQRAVAVGGQRRHQVQSAPACRRARRRPRPPDLRAAHRRRPSTSRATASPTCSWIRFPAAPKPPPATPCGRECRC